MALQRFDAAYVARLRAGDSDTERDFIAYFSPLLLIKARGWGHPRQFAEDVRQETFLRVFRLLRSPDGIRSPEALGGFVCATCRNVMLESQRTEQRHPLASESSLDRACDDALGPEDRLALQERSLLVQGILRALPERDRYLLNALFLEERDKDEICAEFGVNREYLRVLTHRAIAQSRRRWDKTIAARPAARRGEASAPRAEH